MLGDEFLSPDIVAESSVDHECGQVIAELLRNPLLTQDADPDLFRLATLYDDELVRWFREMTGWRLEVHPADGVCRLYKRRRVPPCDRVPLLVRQQRAGRRPASPLVLTLLCLVCEQLWRNPETSFNDLQRDITQTCATEAAEGKLPQFQPVAQAGEEHARANTHRVALVDAVRLLLKWHVIKVDRPIDIAEQDDRADLLISARRERLIALQACPSPTLLNIDLTKPETHIESLCSDQAELPEHVSMREHERRRRHLSLRAVLDDPGVPVDSSHDVGRYLTSPAGRRRATTAAAAAGLVCVIRRDWWTVADPEGGTTECEFPRVRTQEQQAALVLLYELAHRQDPTAPISVELAAALLRKHLEQAPWWARRYRGQRGPGRLAEIACQQLADAGVLAPPTPEMNSWQPTSAIHLWSIRIINPQQHHSSSVLDESDLVEDKELL